MRRNDQERDLPPEAFVYFLRYIYRRGKRWAPRVKSHMHAGITQLHSMRRDEGGNFNDLSGGIPAFTKEFERQLEKVASDMVNERAARSSVDVGAAVDDLLDHLTLLAPREVRAMLWLRDRPKFRDPPTLADLACELSVPQQAVYQLRMDCENEVWDRIPQAVRDIYATPDEPIERPGMYISQKTLDAASPERREALLAQQAHAGKSAGPKYVPYVAKPDQAQRAARKAVAD